MIFNQQAEQSVIGTLLMEGSLMDDVILSPEHFSDKRHLKIFQAMRTIYEANEPVNIVTVTTVLKDKIREVGSVTYMTELATSVPTTATFKHHQRLVLDAYRHRITRAAAIRYVKDPGDETYDTLSANMDSYREVGIKEDEGSVREVLIEIAKEMKNPVKDGYDWFLNRI